jgi:hypothetical protein
MRSFEGRDSAFNEMVSAAGAGLVASRDFGPMELFWKTTLNQ